MGKTIEAERSQTNAPAGVEITRDGIGVPGLTVLVRVYLGSDITLFVDFADGVFKAGGHTTADLVLAELGFGFYTRDGGIDLSAMTIPVGDDHLLFVYDISVGGPGSDVDTVQLVDPQADLRQSWSPKVNAPGLEFRGIIHLEKDGESVDLPDPGAACTFQAYLAAGTLVPEFNSSDGSATLVSVGTDSWFDVQAIILLGPNVPAAGTTIIVRATITGSGVGGGTHNGETSISFPEFS